VTTSVYLPKDRMALTLNGTNEWPAAKSLIRFAEGRSLAPKRQILQIFERVSDALTQTSKDVRKYIKNHPEFREVGKQMLEHWELGLKSLAE
jgi:serine/threonine-protein kinase HipA